MVVEDIFAETVGLRYGLDRVEFVTEIWRKVGEDKGIPKG